ncbi:MAG: selenium metabolism-associated LysR family transcriptional regulator [Desulfitobacterium hafniense]|nr:selenium metabolism-associated LysR family transcriptional regulator [Desulfitobacterium hafniense]
MLDLMRLFVQVAEEQSISSVARRLGITQPAVSNQMRALEEKLGIKLFVRKGKGLVLTPQGEITFQYANRLLAEWNELIENIRALSEEMAGKIHIGASHIPGEYLLPFYLASFQREYPKVRLKISIADSLQITEKLLAQEVDFAVVGASFDNDRIKSETWLEDRIKLVVSEQHPLNSKGGITLDDLYSYPMIVREHGSGHRRALEEALRQRGHSLDRFPIGLEAGSSEAVKNAVRSGLGYSFLSSSSIQTYAAEGLCAYDVEGLTIERAFYMLTRRDKKLTPVASVCYRFLLQLNQSILV